MCHKRTHALQHVHTPLPFKIANPSRFTENQSFAVNLRYRGRAGAGDRPACSTRCVLAARSRAEPIAAKFPGGPPSFP
jgi:hypothetical protein